MKEFDTELGTAYNADCFEIMELMPDGCVDMILCDLPYGTTQNKWDTVIPFEPMWKEFHRIAKPNAAIVLTAQCIFSARLIVSNEKNYRYSLIWEKSKAGGFLNAKRMPLQSHEDVLIFYKKQPCYFPQMEAGKPYIKKAVSNGDGQNYGKFDRTGQVNINKGERYPKSVIKISNPNNGSLHPTQKPVALFEYLIKTYTNEGDLVFDPTAGSLTTGVAANNLNRQWVCVEQDSCYFEKGCARFNL